MIVKQGQGVGISVETGEVADLAITTAKIAALAVTQAKMALLSVGTPELIAASVTNAKLGLASVDVAQVVQTGRAALKALRTNAGNTALEFGNLPLDGTETMTVNGLSLAINKWVFV